MQRYRGCAAGGGSEILELLTLMKSRNGVLSSQLPFTADLECQCRWVGQKIATYAP